MNKQQILFEEAKIIQEVIKKMGNNSFLLKGWSITLIVACLISEKYARNNLYLCFIPTIVFWGLDAYFLRQERLYRSLYNWVIKNRLVSDEHVLDLDTSRFRSQTGSLLKFMFTPTLLFFYGLTAVFVIILLLFIKA